MQQCIVGFTLRIVLLVRLCCGCKPLLVATLPQLAPWKRSSKRWKRSLLWPCSFLINAFDDRPMGDAFVMLLMDAHRMLLLLSREVLLWKILCTRVQLSSELRQLLLLLLLLHRQLRLSAAQRPLKWLRSNICSRSHHSSTLRCMCAAKEGVRTLNFLSRLHCYNILYTN